MCAKKRHEDKSIWHNDTWFTGVLTLIRADATPMYIQVHNVMRHILGNEQIIRECEMRIAAVLRNCLSQKIRKRYFYTRENTFDGHQSLLF